MNKLDDDRECIDLSDECVGEVVPRMALSGTGESFFRCDHHWGIRLDKEAEIRTNYPDSPTPPAWFDPLAAGEHWDEDY